MDILVSIYFKNLGVDSKATGITVVESWDKDLDSINYGVNDYVKNNLICTSSFEINFNQYNEFENVLNAIDNSLNYMRDFISSKSLDSITFLTNVKADFGKWITSDTSVNKINGKNYESKYSILPNIRKKMCYYVIDALGPETEEGYGKVLKNMYFIQNFISNKKDGKTHNTSRDGYKYNLAQFIYMYSHYKDVIDYYGETDIDFSVLPNYKDIKSKNASNAKKKVQEKLKASIFGDMINGFKNLYDLDMNEVRELLLNIDRKNENADVEKLISIITKNFLENLLKSQLENLVQGLSNEVKLYDMYYNEVNVSDLYNVVHGTGYLVACDLYYIIDGDYDLIMEWEDILTPDDVKDCSYRLYDYLDIQGYFSVENYNKTVSEIKKKEILNTFDRLR